MLTPAWRMVQGGLRRRPWLLPGWALLPAAGLWLAPAGCVAAVLAVGGARALGGLGGALAVGGALTCVLVLLPVVEGGLRIALAAFLGLVAVLALPMPGADGEGPVVAPVVPARQRRRQRLAVWALLAAGVVALVGLPWPDLALIALAVLMAAHASGDQLRAATCVLTAGALADSLGGGFALTAVLASGVVALGAWHPGQRGWRRWMQQATLIAVMAVLGLLLGGPWTAAGPPLAWVVWCAIPPQQGGWLVLPPAWRWFTLGKLRGDPLYRLLAADPRPWGRVLDVGCGHGLGAVVAGRRGDATRWEGLDLDGRKLAVAGALVATMPAPPDGWHLRAARLPGEFASDPADTVLALDILHYWEEPAQAELLRWLAARLAPGGVLWLREGVLDDPASGAVVAGERFTTAIGLNPASRLHFRATAGWEELFAATGLAVEARVEAGGANRLWRLRAV